MEARKITIANSRDQKKHVITSAATTLGELKRDLDEAGIDYTDMDFIEALTKTQLKDNSSVLPHDVPYQHTTTNELVFLLTVPNRKIKSGVTRDEVYNAINNHPRSNDLKNAIKDFFGRNYTMVSTIDLANYISTWADCDHENEPVGDCTTLEMRVSELESKIEALQEAIMCTVDILDDRYDTSDITDALAGFEKKDRTIYSAGMSAEQIDQLVGDID